MFKKLVLSLGVLAFTLPQCPLAAWAEANPTVLSKQFQNTASSNTFKMLEGVALNASAGTRTLTLTTKRLYSKLVVTVVYTFGNASAVTNTIECSPDGTAYGFFQTRDLASGTATLYKWTDSKTTSSANQTYVLEYDVRACEKVRLIFAGTGANGSDLVDVYATGVVGL